MKRLTLAFASAVLFLALSGCKCSVEKAAVSQVEASHKLIATQLLKYVAADPKLSAKDKDDWVKLVEADQRNIDALKKAME
jgi:chaperone required for assembly of F1-ATPase